VATRTSHPILPVENGRQFHHLQKPVKDIPVIPPGQDRQTTKNIQHIQQKQSYPYPLPGISQNWDWDTPKLGLA
jgi:hypothetical protein